MQNTFKDNFLWGASTSAFQVEGAYNSDEKGLSVADIASFKSSDEYADTKVASDFYHKYKEDIKDMSELGLKSYRFSINWTRLFPNGDEVEVNEKGVQFYIDVFEELRKYKIEPIVTLYHFDLPYGLVKKYGGWQSRECIDDFVKYAKVCFERFGSYVNYWLTINEQNLMVRKDKLMMIEADSELEKEQIRHKMNHHMFLANAKVMALCHELCEDAKIGPTIAYLPSYPATSDPKDVMAALEADNLFNNYMSDVYVQGKYPQYYLNYLKHHNWLPNITEEDKLVLSSARPDFLGFNYYVTFAAEYCPADYEEQDYTSILNLIVPGYFKFTKNNYLQATEYGWQIDPVGFRKSLMDLYSRYQLPLMITENGIGTHDELSADNKIHDSYRIEYLKNHLSEMKKAIADGVEVISYNTWTFIDVVSSSNGFSKRYGLIYVDRTESDEKELARIKKDSYYYYQEVIKTNGENL